MRRRALINRLMGEDLSPLGGDYDGLHGSQVLVLMMREFTGVGHGAGGGGRSKDAQEERYGD